MFNASNTQQVRFEKIKVKKALDMFMHSLQVSVACGVQLASVVCISKTKRNTQTQY